MGNHHKLRLFLFDEFGDGVGAGTDGVGAFGRFVLLLGDLGFGAGTQAQFLLLRSFWPVFLQQFEQLRCCKQKKTSCSFAKQLEIGSDSSMK